MSEPETTRDGDRIAKWLARAGVASRRDAERLIAEGRVALNGTKIAHPATFVTAGDIVQVNGAVIDAPDRPRLWRFHKRDGLMTTHKDPEGRPTVFEKLPKDMPRVVSVGRLDLNSEGLLLLTNDGALARQLELPSNGWIRRYRVRVHGDIEPAALAALANGGDDRRHPLCRHRSRPGQPQRHQCVADGKPARRPQPRNQKSDGPS